MTTDNLDAQGFFSEPHFTEAAVAILLNSNTRLQAALQFIDDINRTSSEGATLLVFAILRVSCSSVELLVRERADVNLAASDKMTPLKAAAMVGSLKIMRLLLDHSSNPNVVDEDGCTPLHYASQQAIIEADNDSLEVANTSRVELLLRYGALVDAQNYLGITPLMMACEMGGESCAKALVRAGGNPDLGDLTGLTARQLARPWAFKEETFSQQK